MIRRTTTHRLLLAAIAATLLVSVGPASAQFQDRLVQAPTLAAPERGSVKGTLSGLGFSASEVSRGGFQLPLPISVPDERGPLQANVVPRYSPDRGLSEWGMGWGVELAIKRHRWIGELDFQSDDFTSPWGPLKQGNDGFFYPVGLAAPIRVTRIDPPLPARFFAAVDSLLLAALGGTPAAPAEQDWAATEFDGTQYRFSATAGIRTEQGSYSWHLTEVRNLVGDRTTLVWDKNASGRPFLSRVAWGGGTGTSQYELALRYQPLSTALVEHSAGIELALDRRVATATLSVRDAVSGTLSERWRDTLRYQNAPFGPAFYLQTIQRTFASGQTEPAMAYSYELDATRLTLSPLQHYDGLDAVFRDFGDNVLQPDRGTLHDVDNDGRIDLEYAADLTLAKHTDAGWVATALPPASETHPNCRPQSAEGNPPRTLTRMTADLGEPQVVFTQLLSVAPLTTQILVCDRLGHAIADLTIPDDWRLGPNTRLVDIDRDRRPDIVRVSGFGVEILHNDSDAQGIRFTALPLFSWDFGITPRVTWLHDFDGDGNIDITIRLSSAFYVFYGLGQHRWTTTPRAFEVLTQFGPLPQLDRYKATFVDANKDGLTDLMLTRSTTTWLFTNRGTAFQDVAVSGLNSVTSEVGVPVVADVTGRGNTEVVFPSLGSLYFVELANASTGLMASASDGMGTVARFAYARSKPVPGFETRTTVLDQLTLESSGYDPVQTRYTYGAPVAHSVSRQLIGFASVQRTSPQRIEQTDFLHSDDVSGLATHTGVIDGRSSLLRFADTAYQPAALSGIAFQRVTSSTSGTRRSDGTASVATTTTYQNFVHEHCPTRVTTDTGSGTLVTESTLAQISELAGLPHCTVASVTLQGQHARADFDFSYSAEIERNPLGQPTRVRQLSTSAEWVLQDVLYDSAHRPTVITQPGLGAVTLRWDTGTGLLREVVAPDGVITTSRQRDPLTDGLRELGIDRGDSPWVSWFRYDGQERLWRSWDDLGEASEANPAIELTYAFADSARPGRIHSRQMLTPGSYRETVDLSSGSGETLATLVRGPEQWQVGGLRTADLTELDSRWHWRAPLPQGDLGTLDWATLRRGATTLARSVAGGAGQTLSSEQVLGTGVTRRAETSESIVGTTVVSTSVENGTLTTEVASDASGKVRWSKDAAGYLTAFDYDALGRLITVTLQDGSTQTLQYDSFGRAAAMIRPGLATIRYSYDPITGLATRKQVFDGDGALERTVDWTRDAIGRTTHELHQQPRRNARREIQYGYDGWIDGAEVPGQRGLLSEVSSPDFTRQTLYERDGQPRQTSTRVADWRELEQAWTRYQDGSIKDETWTVKDGQKQELARLVQTNLYDAWGRLAEIRVDGARFATVSYDGEGRVDHVDLIGGAGVALRYDATTHAQNGTWTDAGSWLSGFEWQRDARGHIASETITVGDTTWQRQHEYDARGFLTRTHDAGTESRSSYGATGLATSMTDLAGARPITRDARSIRAGADGADPYQLDASGRVFQHDGLTLTWGPTGEIDQAARGARTWEYLYDEAGQRIGKREGGVMTAAYIGPVVVSEDRAVLPVKLHGQLIGSWELTPSGNRFELVASDVRGTVLADRGMANLATPYGVRAQRLPQSAVLDYVERGYDADLGTVRFGVRDYDPLLGQFWSPDPLLLESLDRCAASPVQCNLYGYAKGNPVSFHDPTGTIAWVVPLIVVAILEFEGAANAPALDTPSQAIQRSPSTWDLAASAAKMVVVGAAAGAAAGLAAGAGVVAAGAAAGATGAVTARGWEDVSRGEFSGAGAYAKDSVFGAVFGGALGAVARGANGRATASAAAEGRAAAEVRAVAGGATRAAQGGEYLAGKAPKQVTPGTRVLEGKYVNDLGRVEPWRAHYDEYGRLVGRTDFNAGNAAHGIPDTHYHVYDWSTRGAAGREIVSHAPGEYVP